MEPPHAIYNQAGPSNFAIPFSQDGRSPHHNGAGRGRGHRHVNGNFHQAQQQPFYTSGVPSSYAGYSMGINGINGAPMHGQYGPAQNGPPPRRPGPSFHAGNYQAPVSPALHPTHMYNPHAAPFIPPTAVPGPAPMYPYPHTPTHLQPYPTAFSPPVHHPPHHFPNHQNLKSPLVSPLHDHVVSPWRALKTQQPSSPRPLQVSLVPLPQHQTETPSPSVPSNSITPSFPTADDLSRPVEHPPSSPSPKLDSPVIDTQISLPSNSPSSPKIVLPSFDDEPAPRQEWVISLSRPDNPAAAFGIMISPKAKPPSHIVKGAQEYVAPARPKTPVKEPVPDASPESKGHGSTGAGEDSFVDVLVPQTEHASCSTTETGSRTSTVPDTFVAGSPLSTATSVSIPLPKADEKENVPVAESGEPSESAESPEPTVSVNILPSTPAHAESTVPSPNAKKSWASLLRSESSSSSKTSLPTSTVQGFSIPASSGGSSSAASVPAESTGKRGDLLRLLNNGPSASSNVPQIRPRGLVNTGNMCFANAVLQTLVYTPPFFRLFTELGKYISGIGASSTKWADKDTPLVDATVEFLKAFMPKAKDTSKDLYEEDDDDYAAIDSFIPSYVYDAMKEKRRFENMGGGQQEDAEEFFGFFMDTIEEELLAISNSLKNGFQSRYSAQEHNANEGDGWLEVGKKNKPIIARTTKSVDSPMTRIFGGKFRSTLKVRGQRDSVMVEDWRSVKLDIQREQVDSIEDALRYISEPQPVQMSSVTKGGAVVDASQQVLVDALPPILVLHLKRFLYDTTARDVVKVHKQVTYGPDLEIPSDVLSPARRTAHPAKYKLFAVLYHHGSSAAGGHYTLDVLHPNRNADPTAKPREGWIRIDDELVTDLRTEEVFGNERDCAYLLFYRRIAGSYARAGQV